MTSSGIEPAAFQLVAYEGNGIFGEIGIDRVN
jgi:hypothetical protein